VEDSPIIRDRLTESISTSGRIEIIGHADTEQQAIESLRQLDCDAVVLDLRLREGNGFNVLKALRVAAGVRVTIIVFTNYSLPQFRTRSLALGADYFFDKGHESDRVREVLEEMASADPSAA
jgi:DNA-binding NarL/FixJ family response regulator